MALTADEKIGPVFLSPCPECGIVVQPLSVATGCEVVQVRQRAGIFERAQTMDPSSKENDYAVFITRLTKNSSCEEPT